VTTPSRVTEPGVSESETKADVQSRAIIRSVYMAPFGAPVLPEVYMIIASRSSLPAVYTGSGGNSAPRATTSPSVWMATRRPTCRSRACASSRLLRCSLTPGW
jgi:hypothetical protein